MSKLKFYLFQICFLLSGVVASQGNKENRIIHYTTKQKGYNSTTDYSSLSMYRVSTIITYFDGLGRPMQTVQTGQSPNGFDIIQPIAYDEYGRESKQYLPYVIANEATGIFKENALADPSNTDPDPLIRYQSGAQYNFYQTATNIANDPSPYSEKVFEPSPLNRMMEQGAPGAAWQPVEGNPTAGKTIKFGYEINTLEDKVYLWFLDETDQWPSKAAEGGHYPTSELYKNITTDEEGNRVIEFIDKLQRTILKRVQAVDTPNLTTYVAGEWADTYYIYDDFGNLRFVLPPEAIANIEDYGN